MTFLAPALLWSFLALIPLAAIYFLKVRPRRKPTTAFFLWEKIFQEKRSNRLFQRLRDVWSLLLMLLAASAICLALGRPEWADERQDLLILVDHSASMSAREARSTRLELAKRMANKIIEGLNGNQRAAIAVVGQNLSYVSHLTDNPRQLLDAIEQIRETEETLSWDALPQRHENAQWQRKHRVVFVSDGCFGNNQLPAHIELLKVGTPQENVGLVAADMTYLPGGKNQLAFYFQIASTNQTTREIDLTVSRVDDAGAEQLFKVIPLAVEPGVSPSEVFVLDNALPGRWLARLETDDALPNDNVAYLAAVKPKPVKVSGDASDPYFFENSVLAFSRGYDL